MIRKSLLVAVALLLPVFAQAETRLLRHPTYARGKVAFSYLGDIWLANEDGSNVQRLTVHKARDIYPRFSPDGSQIAFSSNRQGNFDVYVMSIQGGKPRQLTFHNADDMVVGWTPDGRKIIFQSSRSKGVFPSVSTLFEVPVDGGMEQPLPTDWGSWASYSADGGKLAFTRHPGVWSRKHYRGSYSVDLWLMDLATKKFTRLGDEDYKGNYLWPMYGRNGEIYFVADCLPDENSVKPGTAQVMRSVNNIWKLSDHDVVPGKLTQVTHHTDGNLFFPSISADGETIVYEENFGLWKLDAQSGRSTRIPIDIKSDIKDNEVELRTIASEAESFSLSPSAKRAAICTHGEIFTIATDRGELQRVTDTFWREESPRWSPSGKWIAFISDRSGREELWLADERGQNLKQISSADCDKSAAVWASDSKSLMWEGSDHKLRLVEIESGRTQILASSDVGFIGTPQFSPDGKWISYTKQDSLLRSHVYVKPLDGGAERMIKAEEFLTSSGAKWTPDGKKLLVLGGVGAAAMASLNRSTSQLYSIGLVSVEKDPNEKDIDTEEQAEGGQGGSDAFRRGPSTRPATTGPGTAPATAPITRFGGASASRVEVKIEWKDLEHRVRQLTRVSGAVSSVVPSPDSRTYAFVASGGEEGSDVRGGPALYTIGEDGTRLTRLVDGASAEPSDGAPRGRGFGGGFGEVQWTKDSRSIYYLQGGGIYSVGVPAAPASDTPAPSTGGSRFGGMRGFRGSSAAAVAPSTESASSTPKRVNFTVRMEVDATLERRQVFEEAWRAMKVRFYDPRMHGVDWSAAKALYQPLLADVSDPDELHTVIMEMIGELNASHTGISGGDSSAAPRVDTRYPGFDLEPDSSGFYKVSYIYKKGPADHEYVKLKLGNYLLALNGKELKTSDNYWRLFTIAPGRKFEFTVNSRPEKTGAWTVSIEPISGLAQDNLNYDRWVDSRKEMVDRLSGGQIGYLHIKAMDSVSLQKFQRDLLINQAKKALIIDERFNGGGGIDQELLEILNQRRPYQSFRGRDSVQISRPSQAFFGPMAVLQNERSASNAEMFPDGFRTLGLGKVIGVPTYGAVIGTGSFRLMDGSSIRTPGFGVYTARQENMENFGVQPDVMVDNTPEDFLAGHDRQIEKAVEVLQAQMR